MQGWGGEEQIEAWEKAQAKFLEPEGSFEVFSALSGSLHGLDPETHQEISVHSTTPGELRY